MFPINQTIRGVSNESLSEDNTYFSQLTESDQKQFCFQNGPQNVNNFQIFQESKEMNTDCLWLHSSPDPFSSIEDTSSPTYQDHIYCSGDPSINTPIWPYGNCQFINDPPPICKSTQLPLLPCQQLEVPVHHTTQPYQRPVMSRNHKAQITVVPTSTGKFKAVVKRKRKRTIFTTEQIEALEQYFTKKPYITREDRQVLVNKLQLNDKAVKIWFQNRRLKGKRANEYASSESELIGECSSPNSRLDYVESQINQKTDEFGYVTLDDTLMGNLVDVIDSIMSNKYKYDMPSEESTTALVSSPIYEPISPADCTIEEESPTQWSPFEPKESLQRLFDLHSIIPI